MNEKDQYESLACNCVEVGTLIKEDDTLLTLDIKAQRDTLRRRRILHNREKGQVRWLRQL